MDLKNDRLCMVIFLRFHKLDEIYIATLYGRPRATRGGDLLKMPGKTSVNVHNAIGRWTSETETDREGFYKEISLHTSATVNDSESENS